MTMDAGDSNEQKDVIRGAQEIARRALALFSVVGLSMRIPRADIIAWLQEEGLWSELTPDELAFVTTEEPTAKQSIDASWRSEALIVLLWALQKVDTIPPSHEQCDTAVFQQLLPPFIETPVEAFIETAVRRSNAALVEMADELLDLHWQSNDPAHRARRPPPYPDAGIARERQHAINWIIGYDGAAWDDVTTDT